MNQGLEPERENMKRIGITILGVVIALMNVGWHYRETVSANPDSPKYTADNQLSGRKTIVSGFELRGSA